MKEGQGMRNIQTQYLWAAFDFGFPGGSVIYNFDGNSVTTVMLKLNINCSLIKVVD